MPSPIAHISAGYVLYRFMLSWRPTLRHTPILALLACFGFSMLPDTDAAIGILLGDLGRYHNNLTHSLPAGLAVAGAAFAVSRTIKRLRWLPWWLPLVCYLVHVLMDAFTDGRGVMLLWPFSDMRVLSPVIVFYGLHWSQGLFSIKHVWTALGEGALSALVIALVHLRLARPWCPPRSGAS